MRIQRTSFWVMLMAAILVVVTVGIATFRATPTVHASRRQPAQSAQSAQQATHQVGFQAAVQVASRDHTASRTAHFQWVAACTKAGDHLLINLGGSGPSEFGNYGWQCIQGDGCATIGTQNPDSYICLYQDANFGGQELDFYGHGCANLTDFAGPGPGGTWNDTMSSFRIFPGSATSGAFWWDTNDKGYYYLFGPDGSGRVSTTTYIGNTWNDQASSILLDPNPNTQVC